MARTEFRQDEIVEALDKKQFTREMGLFLHSVIRELENTETVRLLVRALDEMELIESQQQNLDQLRSIIRESYAKVGRLDWTAHRVEGFVSVAEVIWKLKQLLGTSKLSAETIFKVVHVMGIQDIDYSSEADRAVVNDDANYVDGYRYGNEIDQIYVGPHEARERYLRNTITDEDVRKVFFEMMEMGLVTF